MGLLAAGLTDIGRKRSTNQDAIYLNSKQHLFVVADGMGGHRGGDIASALAVKYIPAYMSTHKDLDPIKANSQSIQYANQKIKEYSNKDTKLQGMGTTVSSMHFKGRNLYASNVGDSRTYLINNHRLYQLTRDHSLVQEKLNLGIYNRVQACKDPQKNVLVRTVGFEDNIDVDVFTYRVSRYDMFLSCSDGLYGKVNDADIIYLINQIIPDPKKAQLSDLKFCCQKLVDLANQNGGNDNISVVLVAAV